MVASRDEDVLRRSGEGYSGESSCVSVHLLDYVCLFPIVTRPATSMIDVD